jgi:hypothetical protein
MCEIHIMITMNLMCSYVYTLFRGGFTCILKVSIHMSPACQSTCGLNKFHNDIKINIKYCLAIMIFRIMSQIQICIIMYLMCCEMYTVFRGGFTHI